MQVNPYLSMPGTAWAAAQFYAEVFGAPRPEPMWMGDVPDEGQEALTEDEAKLVAHVRVPIGDRELMISDHIEKWMGPHRGFAGFDVQVACDTPEEAHDLYAKLADGGTPRMPIGPTFWARAFGSLTDRFGVHWMVNCD